jgi:hypothetical protein
MSAKASTLEMHEVSEKVKGAYTGGIIVAIGFPRLLFTFGEPFFVGFSLRKQYNNL